jgi:hypothetical protein
MMSRLRLEADSGEKRGKQLLKDSLSTTEAPRHERISRDAVSLLVKAARLRKPSALSRRRHWIGSSNESGRSHGGPKASA